jgi:hypothetical protein
MSRKVFHLACACAVLVCAAATARADLRIKQRTTTQGQSFESDVAIKGQRQRTEQQLGPAKNVSIMQCDMKRILNISEAARKYTVTPLVGESADAGGAATSASPARPASGNTTRRGGVVTYVTTMTDTGERKQMFGFPARRIKTVMKSEASPDACNTETFHYETDGWYIDFDFNFDCLTGAQAAAPNYGGPQPECQDRVRYRRVGTAKLGYPVQVTTSFFKGGQVQFTQTTEVVELSRATLDAALFDVPAGYTEARDARELYDPAAMAAAMQAQQRDNDDRDESGSGASGNSMSAAPAASSPASVGAKRAGVVRVGVIPPSNKTDKQVGIDALRAQLVAALSGGNVEAVALEASSPGGLEAEARTKECDFMLYTDIVALKQSAASKVGGFLSRATGAGDAKEKFEARIEFSLVPAGSATPLLESNATAKEDGTADAAVASALRREAQLVAAKVRK